MVELHVLDTHLYPGARGVLEGAAILDPGPCLVVFSDGAVAAGEIGIDQVLTVAGHTTGAGTAIGPKSWRLALEGRSVRVVKRAASQGALPPSRQ